MEEYLDAGVVEITSLHYLNLEGNELTQIPESIYHLNGLQKLILGFK